MNLIRDLRERSDLTQARLRKELGWSQARLANYELGIRKPGLDEARKIVLALNALGVECTLDDVFPNKDIESVA